MDSDLFKKQRTLETYLNHRLDDFVPKEPKRLEAQDERDIIRAVELLDPKINSGKLEALENIARF
jgi:hypothetical protein